MKIVQISDIHWRGLTRHEEYTKAFESLFKKIREIKPDIIFLGGDYFHTKTSGISPEVIDRLSWMFKSMADICHTHMILGNHDGNLANEERQDVISPIVNAMRHPQLHLYKDSGNYPISQDIHLAVYSCFDKSRWPMAGMITGPVVNIAAFHGSVGGTQMDNGWVMPDNKAEVMLKMFRGYDFVLLGDIHKRQFLAERPDKNGAMKPWIAYPGSTIQQNFGEDEVKGFLVWDIRTKDDWDVNFVEVENFQPFITLPWKNTVKGTLEALQSIRTLLPGSRYRITSVAPLSPLLERQLCHELKVVHGGEQVVFKAQKTMSFDTIETDGISIRKASLRNNVEALRVLYKQFLDANAKKYILSEDQIQEGILAIDRFLVKLNLQETEVARDITWSIKNFEFDNLYRYGEGNRIDFENLTGVVGVLGNNKIGKSSLIGALMYVLFNDSDRDGVTKNGQVMNQTKKSCSAKAVVTVNGQDYLIERSSTRVEAPKRGKKAGENHDLEKTETKLNLSRINPDGSYEELNGITRDETDKIIRKLLGNPQDFLMTSVATQSKMERFIEEGTTARKTILNRFLDLDIFEKLFGFAKEEVVLLNAKTSTYSMGWEQSILDLQGNIQTKTSEIQELERILIPKTRSQLDSLRLWIAQNESVKIAEAEAILVKCRQEISNLKQQLGKTELDYKSLNLNLINISQEILRLQTAIDSIDVEVIQEQLRAMNKLQVQVDERLEHQKEQQNNIKIKEKSIAKLALVPCGDGFPTCLYLKDSYQDKLSINKNLSRLNDLTEQLAKLVPSLKEYRELQLGEKMDNVFSLEQKRKELTKEQVEKQARLVLIGTIKEDQEARLELAKKKEMELVLLLADQDLEAIIAKKLELLEVQKIAFTEERKRNDLLVALGKDNAFLEQIQKDKAECEQLLGKLRVLESVQAAFHKNGIPAIVLKTQLPAINSELSKLLGSLVDFGITFETEAGSNVMDIFIEDGHSRRILELGSGMEKMLASIAIRVALINLSSLPTSDILIIDEGWGSLDMEHLEKAKTLIQQLKQYFKTIIIISHIQEIKECADILIEVTSTGIDSMIVA